MTALFEDQAQIMEPWIIARSTRGMSRNHKLRAQEAGVMRTCKQGFGPVRSSEDSAHDNYVA
jgi:hypothetical protein